jgi:hypothetical protein
VKDHRTTRALAAAALAITLGACMDAPTTPAAARITSADHPARTVSASGATLVPNTVRYRDEGGKPTRGRAGSAALEAFALLDKDGRTDLELAAVAADPALENGQGILARAHVKALDADSTLMFVKNLNAIGTQRHTVQLGHGAPGQFLEVQANVEGIDPHRTDVVTVTERVKLRPDLSVRFQMPERVPARQPVVVSAIVSELNGEVGAHADCVLRVDGRYQDRVGGAWIDAGDAVTCAFTVYFAVGAHDVQVAVEAVRPGDWDPANNTSAVVRVEAEDGPVELSYNANAWTQRTTSRFRDDWWWHDASRGLRGEGYEERTGDSDEEAAYFYAYTNRVLPGPVVVEVSQISGGRVVHADTWTVTEDGCQERYTLGTSFNLCRFNYGDWANNTYFAYVHQGGTITYHSSRYQREWDEITGEDLFYYHYNESGAWNFGPLAGFANDYAFHVRLTSGDQVVTTESRFPLEFGRTEVTEAFCLTSEYEWGYTASWCRDNRTEWSGVWGEDSRWVPF